MRPADTAPEAWVVQLAHLRSLTREQRLLRAIELSQVVEELAKA